MNRTVVFAAALILVAAVVDAQPTSLAGASEVTIEAAALAVNFTAAKQEEPGFSFTFVAGSPAGAAAEASLPVRLNLTSALQVASYSWSISQPGGFTFSLEGADRRKRETPVVDWIGIFTEQVRFDGIMHLKRMTEPKTVKEVAHSSYYGGYVEAVKGYFTHGFRWNDGDPFFNNDINHPLMGAISSHIYMNHDRRCNNVGYGQNGYWGCIARATAYSALASVNWEWNPLMSESALGHVGKFHTCVNGKCTGEGGWTDFVMTPLGGMGVAIAGDIARAKLWPVLDRHLSGNVAARVLKVAVKIATDPAGFANAALNANFSGALSTGRYTGRR